MASKKEYDAKKRQMLAIQQSLSQEDKVQLQQQLAQYHAVAQSLYDSPDQVETILAGMTSMSEAAQITMLKALAKENTVDAADVLVAMNTFAPLKEVRKEARRSLIRLEETNIYPQWTPPAASAPVVVAITPPRFWKGLVSDTKDSGEVQLLLFWEQGAGYKDVRMLGFLLEFWHDGVKDFFVQVDSKGSTEEHIDFMCSQQSRVRLTDCTLAAGRRLLEEALDTNKKHGTKPYKGYTSQLPLIRQLILEAADSQDDVDNQDDVDGEEVSGPVSISSSVDVTEAVKIFLQCWSDEEYESVYDLLTHDSPIRGELSREEWIESRRQWRAEAQPERMHITCVHERTQKKPSGWLPSLFTRKSAPAGKQVDAYWSLDLADSPSSATLIELPKQTITYEELGRQWFWTSYTVVEQDGSWYIQDITDEGTHALSIPVAELQRRLKEHQNRIEEEIMHNHQPIPDAPQYSEELVWRVLQTMHYDDACLAQLPPDYLMYMDAAGRAMFVQAHERCLAYMEQVAQHFSEHRGESLIRIVTLQYVLEAAYSRAGNKEVALRFRELTVATLHEVLAIENKPLGHMLLAELLEEEDITEAERHLREAEALNPTEKEQASIHNNLGRIAAKQEQYEQALSRFQHVAECDPEYPEVWLRIGRVQHILKQHEDARKSFQRYLETGSGDVDAYTEVATIYIVADDLVSAEEILDQGIAANPDTGELLLILASLQLQYGHMTVAENLFKQAEALDPDLEMAPFVRMLIDASKGELQVPAKLKKLKPKKRR